MASMRRHDWPGNVRELKNVVERSVYSWGERMTPVEEVIIDPFDSPYQLEHPRKETPAPETGAAPAPAPQKDGRKVSLPLDYRQAVAAFEKNILEEAMAANRFHQRDTAAALGLTYDQLRHALKKHGLL